MRNGGGERQQKANGIGGGGVKAGKVTGKTAKRGKTDQGPRATLCMGLSLPREEFGGIVKDQSSHTGS